MTLSASTIAILTNFASINPNFLYVPGKPISTIAAQNNIVAYADIPEQFEREFGIYDLSTFLSAVGLFDNPTIDLGKDAAVISSGGNQKVNYRFADPSILKVLDKAMKLPDMDVSVELSEELIAKLRKAASVLSLSMASITRKDGVISISTMDPKNTSADSWSAELASVPGPDFDLQFLIANMKIIPGSYRVDLSKRFFSTWTHSSQPVKYHVALEKTSTFGA